MSSQFEWNLDPAPTITVSAVIPDCIEQLKRMLPRDVERVTLRKRDQRLPISDHVPNCSYLEREEAYFKNMVKRLKLLDEMATKARAEVLRIEAARLEAHRILLRRKAELSSLVPTGNRKSLLTHNGRQQGKENNKR